MTTSSYSDFPIPRINPRPTLQNPRFRYRFAELNLPDLKTKFDPKTLADWSARSVREVTVDFVAGGCAGTKITVTEGSPSTADFVFADIGSLRVHYRDSHKEILASAVITKLVSNGKTKWIVTSEKIKSRCDCGSSFGTDSSVKPLPKIDLSKFLAKRKALAGGKT